MTRSSHRQSTLARWWNDPVDHYWLLNFLRHRGHLAPLRALIGSGGVAMGIALVLLQFTQLTEPVSLSRAVLGTLTIAAFAWPLYWWFFRWPSPRTSITLFILTDLGIAVACAAQGAPMAAMATTPLFAVTGIYLVYFHGPRATAVHLLIAIATVLGVAVWLSLSDEPGAVFLAIGKALVSLLVTVGILPSAQFGFWLIRNSSVESLVDELTSLANRRGLQDHVSRLSASADPLPAMCVLVIDLDKFKTINDRHGHVVGDQVLVRTAHQLRDVVGRRAFLARTGGEEFVVIDRLPSAEAVALGERLRAAVAAAGPPAVTASVGVVCGHLDNAADFDRLLHLADTAMYAAKRDGGNRLAVAQP
ncbi:GGDEF domain-containing protein [Mycolicibacterium frederiksbergense]|uniref:GGDEF domain-containing protein n=1 Tax=Mycolicibacterium frederiksbergense TaxID=117567 RepID=A0A6H0S1W1_9MYCO|nr:GGDEF domain-containing protein [Mycolicibacterium frederiksbergense]QIV81194.1 GGDEF domain-containing protein [Mycolicibacterium frederiksbergense]